MLATVVRMVAFRVGMSSRENAQRYDGIVVSIVSVFADHYKPVVN